MTKEEKADSAYDLVGFTIHNTVESNGDIAVLLEGNKEGQDPVYILTRFKALSSGIDAIKEELEKVAQNEGE